MRGRRGAGKTKRLAAPGNTRGQYGVPVMSLTLDWKPEGIRRVCAHRQLPNRTLCVHHLREEPARGMEAKVEFQESDKSGIHVPSQGPGTGWQTNCLEDRLSDVRSQWQVAG
jgi:hypothetical protein